MTDVSGGLSPAREAEIRERIEHRGDVLWPVAVWAEDLKDVFAALAAVRQERDNWADCSVENDLRATRFWGQALESKRALEAVEAERARLVAALQNLPRLNHLHPGLYGDLYYVEWSAVAAILDQEHP